MSLFILSSDVRSSRSVTPELGFCPKRTSTPKSERNSFITTPPPPIKKPKCEESSVEDTRSMDSIYLSSDINFPSRSSSFYNTSAQAESSVFIYPVSLCFFNFIKSFRTTTRLYKNSVLWSIQRSQKPLVHSKRQNKTCQQSLLSTPS